MPDGDTGCPVTIHARHGAGGDLLAVKDSRPKGTAQLLHVILTDGDTRQITAGDVTVHGLAGKGRFIKTLSARDDSSNAVLDMSVKFSAGDNKDVFADLWVPGMTAVHAVELNSATYSDGSTWKLPTGTPCRAIPDPTMLVSGH